MNSILIENFVKRMDFKVKRRKGAVRPRQSSASEGQGPWYVWGGKSLLVSCLLTVVLLFVLALLVLGAGLTEKIVAVAIIFIYVAATFAGGFLAAKRAPGRKFLWGLLVGLVYFLLLTVISAVSAGSLAGLGDSFLTTMLLCGAGGMLGGMLG